jgi:hypothetical protein
MSQIWKDNAPVVPKKKKKKLIKVLSVKATVVMINEFNTPPNCHNYYFKGC